MSTNQPRFSYVQEYGRYIYPTWLFPIYFFAWGLTCHWLKLQPGRMPVFFVVTAGLPLLGTQLWASQAKKHIPYVPFCFLTIIVPMFIFGAVGLLWAGSQAALRNHARSHHSSEPNHALQPTAGAGSVPAKFQPLQRPGGG